MTIVVDFRIGKDFSPAAAAFWEQFWPGLAKIRPLEKFIFIVSGTDLNGIEIPNIEIKVIKRSSFLWLDKKTLLTFLKESNTNRYIRLYEFGFIVHRPTGKWFQKMDINLPVQIAAFSESLAKEWQKDNSITAPIIHILPAYIQVAGSLSWTETESIKTKFTGGRDYFLFSGDISEKHYLIEMLKGFSLFKKWQQSNMQLVIAAYSDEYMDYFEDKLESYRFKSDVVLIKDPAEDDIAHLTAAAYGAIYPCSEKTMPFYVSRSIQSGTAIIASGTTAVKELTEAVAWIDNQNLEETLSKAMILLYRDENYKSKLVENGKSTAALLNATVMMEKSWEIITGN
jgi:Glycosyl transferases group 1